MKRKWIVALRFLSAKFVHETKNDKAEVGVGFSVRGTFFFQPVLSCRFLLYSAFCVFDVQCAKFIMVGSSLSCHPVLVKPEQQVSCFGLF